MKAKKKREPPAPAPRAPANRPFAEALAPAARAAREADGTRAREEAEARAAREEPGDDSAMFEEALAGVRPLDARDRERVAPSRPPPASAPVYDEEAEALAKLAAMVEGDEPLGDGFSEEHSEWIAPDVDVGILPRLVAGEFAWQDHVDLHGMTREQARSAVTRFLASARVRHLRCVLIVHGRGNHSEDSRPVIKPALQRWLLRAPLSAWVFAWATARSVDGGAGALYVMLRA